MLPIKKFIFLLLRLGKEVALYESIHQNINRALRVLHIGNEVRGREFIKRLYGRLPERRVLDKQFTRTGLEYLKSREIECDLILVEINRLYERRFREEGFFTLPEWIEFGREVVKNGDSRYAGAKKSLKSDLKKIRSADFDVVITKDNDDFYLFYDKMYLPYLSKRFGNTIIKKSRKKVMKDFRSGFLLQLKHDRQPVAGAIVRIDGDVVIQTTWEFWTDRTNS